jgi:SAM-dependent methyltransferase
MRNLFDRLRNLFRLIEKRIIPQKGCGIRFPESRLAHKYLDGLSGIEIGGSAHNPFGLKTRNIDYTDSMETVFKREEQRLCGEAMPVDIIAGGDELPLPDESEDFVISSHVLEHFPDPIKALKEWLRVVRKGGYILVLLFLIWTEPSINLAPGLPSTSSLKGMLPA